MVLRIGHVLRGVRLNTYDKASQIVASIRKQCDRKVRFAIILGSGLGAFVDTLEHKVVIPYGKIDGFPQSGVVGHAGNLVFGRIGGQDIVVMQGRVHFYESGDLKRVTLPIRVLKLLGCERLVVTNAAGACNPAFNPGDLMLITDHLNMMMAGSPLIGENDERFGPRFPDMSEPYNHEMSELIRRSAAELNLKIQEGVYCAFHGPEYETPAEVRLAQKIGADAVGMSTVPEIIVANHMGMKCAGISCMTNKAAGISEVKLSHAEVMEVGKQVAHHFVTLLGKSVEKMLAEL